MEYPTLIIAIPTIILSFLLYLVANIDGLLTYPSDQADIEYWKTYGIQKFEGRYKFLYFGFMFLTSIPFVLFFKAIMIRENEKDTVSGVIGKEEKNNEKYETKDQRLELLVFVLL